MQAVGYSSATASVFPAIIDTAVAVSTPMLVALGDKPVRRARTATMPANTQAAAMQMLGEPATQIAKTKVKSVAMTNAQAQAVKRVPVQGSAPVQPDPAPTEQSTQTEATQADTDLARELIASGVTTQPVETVIAVLAATRNGASTNAAAKELGINYRTAQPIVEGAAERRQPQLVVVG